MAFALFPSITGDKMNNFRISSNPKENCVSNLHSIRTAIANLEMIDAPFLYHHQVLK
jgi:hypothetical protein